MKYLFILLFTAYGFMLNAQVKSGITEFDKTSMSSLSMDLDADYEEVADVWEDFWKDRYDVDFDKLNKNRSSISYEAEQAVVPIISQKNADLYAKFGGTTESARVSFAIAYTANDVVTEEAHPKQYEAARAIMLEFRTFFYTQYFDEKLEKAREDLDDIRDDSSDASKDAEKARSKIEKYESKIEKYQEKIEKMRNEVGSDLETAEEKAKRAQELESKVRELERLRARYVG
ncbi:hypothetical protein FUA23_14030 [Neolewinella aurantiaca]|uniref:Uncharacterized protein n=1 Tax=Neolewinella aurantiaca TaxID=2602767 RepID=A0A5C7FE95_9BACT|nr:hypothetical protein [Neolewinella aurantiaca]TXF88582.1 hypothetical protein FUA23_14030 [Neolewinella aurantiaca]